MRLDIQTLGTFNELAHRGAQASASSLSQLSGTTTETEVTRADLVPLPDLVDEFDDEFVGVEIDLSDGLAGTIVLVFDRASAATLLETIMPDSWGDVDSELDKSGVSEAANIMVGGFVDAWADHFGTKISLGPPEYIAGEWPAVLPNDVPLWNARKTALTFTSQLTSIEETIDFHIYMFPERTSFAALVEDAIAENDVPISIDKLSVFNEMTKEGAGRAANKVTQMTNIETDVDIGRLTFVPITDIEHHVTNERRIGAVTRLQEPPGGSVAILFDVDSALTVADALLPIEVDAEGLTDQHRAAIEEIGNIMTSGFIDGWANTLDRKIQHVPPDVVEDSAAATIGDLVDELEDEQEYAFILDSTVRTPDREVNCDLFAIPEESQFQTVLDELSLESATRAVDDPSELEPSAYEDLQ